MRSYFYTIILFSSLLFCAPSYAATVYSITSVASYPYLAFGRVTPGTTGGTVSSSCGVTGTLKVFSDCYPTRVYRVSGVNNTTGNNRQRFRVYITPNQSMTPYGAGAGAIAATQSLNASSSVAAQNFDFPAGTGTKTLDITVYGKTNYISSTQAAGIYYSQYSVRACTCAPPCNSTPSDCS